MSENSSHVWTGKQERIGENIMMYNEFLEKTEMSQLYISWNEYTEMIEPIYMNSTCNKADFIKEFLNVFNRIVNPTIENFIHYLPLKEKEAFVFSNPNSSEFQKIRSKISAVDVQARKLAYQALDLMFQKYWLKFPSVHTCELGEKDKCSNGARL